MRGNNSSMNLEDQNRHIPWVVYDAKDWLDSFLKKDMRVFEWGSGGSTLYFCKRVQQVISIEHAKEWFDEVSAVLQSEKITNCNYFLAEPKKNSLLHYLPYSTWFYNSKTFPEYHNASFRAYVRKIDAHPDHSLDFVFVDGRARISCIMHAIRKIKKGGYLMLDNSERIAYQSTMRKLDQFPRIDFLGHGPYLEETWQTTIWQIT